MNQTPSYGISHHRMGDSSDRLRPWPVNTYNVSRLLSVVMDTRSTIQGDGCLTTAQFGKFIPGTLPDMKILGREQDRTMRSVNSGSDMTTKRSIWTLQISQGHGQSYVCIELMGTCHETIIFSFIDESTNLSFNALIIRPIRKVPEDVFAFKKGDL